MAAFKTAMPTPPTGNINTDISSLYTSLYSLITELRSLMYTLDGQNVPAIPASSISGTLSEAQMPDVFGSIGLNGSGILFYNDTDNKVGNIYADNNGNLRININGKLYINGSAVTTDSTAQSSTGGGEPTA